VLGWTGGFVLVSILVGPYLRKFGAYTVPDFLAFRYGGNFARFLGVIVLVCCSFTYVTAQIYGTGLIASRFLGMSFELAVFVGLVGILMCAMLGGMKAVTWTQIAQYIVLIVAYLVPIVILSTKKYGIPLPEFTYGFAIQDITAREQQLVKDGLAVLCTSANCGPGTLKPHIQPFMNYTPLNYFGIIFCMMVGTASLPHILMRYFTTPSVREARQSVAWSLLFIFLLYFSAPAYAAFSKLEVYTNIIGNNINTIKPWLFTWGELGLIQICGKAAANLDAVIAACKAIPGHTGVIRFQDFVINTDVIVLSTPEIAGLPYVISGLVAAGGLAAALSTADGLLLAIANALSHDIYFKMIQPLRPAGRSTVIGLMLAAIVAAIIWFLPGPGPFGVSKRWWVLGVGIIPPLLISPFWGKMNDVEKRLLVARVLLLYVAASSAALASTRPSDILAMVGWAFSLAMAGNFPAITMGIWWKRTTTTGAICGIIAGWGICLFYLVVSRYFPQLGVSSFGMTSLLNPETGKALVDVAQVMADPKWLADVPASAANPLGNKVGWFDLNNINCGLLGMPLGFLVIYVVSLFGKPPSKEMQDLIDEIRKPRGNTILENKT
jgi:cation/acetate symporter